MNIKKIVISTLLLFGSATTLFAEGTEGDPETLYKYQVGVDFQVKLTKGLKLNIEPELRYYNGYDKFHLNGGLTYKTFGCIYWGATYRLVVDREESTSSNMISSGWGMNNYESETYHYYAFDVAYKDKFGRFTPSFRVRYNNFMDEEINDEAQLRYRAKVEYNIRKCKISPFVSAEAFHTLDESQIYKMRYVAGFDITTSKKASLSFEYKFDYFLWKYKNAHIFSAGYKYKF